MDKLTYKLNQGQARAALKGGREQARRLAEGARDLINEAALLIYKKQSQWAYDMLENIKNEPAMKLKLDNLWERHEDEPTLAAAARLPKMELGVENPNFPAGYFSKF